MNNLDLRAYNLLLDEERRQLAAELSTAPCDVITEPTHRLDEHIARKVQTLLTLRGNIAYAAMKIKQLKETIGALDKLRTIPK